MCSHLVLRRRQLAHAIGTRRRRLSGFEALSGVGVGLNVGFSFEEALELWSSMGIRLCGTGGERTMGISGDLPRTILAMCRTAQVTSGPWQA